MHKSATFSQLLKIAKKQSVNLQLPHLHRPLPPLGKGYQIYVGEKFHCPITSLCILVDTHVNSMGLWRNLHAHVQCPPPPPPPPPPYISSDKVKCSGGKRTLNRYKQNYIIIIDTTYMFQNLSFQYLQQFPWQHGVIAILEVKVCEKERPCLLHLLIQHDRGESTCPRGERRGLSRLSLLQHKLF